MQYDEQEGVPSTQNCEEIDLRKHLRNNGVSWKALEKMDADIQSGDMNVNALVDCNDNELDTIANDYQLTILQKKAFIRAVNSLKMVTIQKEEKCNDETDRNWNSTSLSAKDQKILMEMDTFLNSLQTVKTNQCLIKKENLLEFEKNIKIIKIKANNIKNTIDNIVNDIENNVCCCILFTNTR